MKALCPLLLTTLMIMGLSVSASAEIVMPAQQQQGEVYFMTGGIAEEASMMRGIAHDYALELIFVQKLNDKGAFLADVDVQVLDAQQQVVLETTTDGPYLYANLPAGQYSVVAKFKEQVKQQKVLVSDKKHQKVVMWWEISEP